MEKIIARRSKTGTVLIITLVIAVVVFFALWIVARLTGAFVNYRVVSGAMEPQLRMDETFFASNLRQPTNGDAICFRHFDSSLGSDQIFVFRLFGMPRDRVEFKDGTLLINGRQAAPDGHFSFQYIIPKSSQSVAVEKFKIPEHEVLELSDSTRLVTLQPHKAKDPAIKARRFLLPEDFADEYIQKKWGQPWNADHFGPVTVPEGHWFLVGDNRKNALDSRYIGFVSQDAFVGTVLRDAIGNEQLAISNWQ